MPIETHFIEENQEYIIELSGDFDSEEAEVFKVAYEKCGPNVQKYILDMSEVAYMDSTALGMLLALKEYAESKGVSVHIIKMNDIILEIFRVLNFHKIFKPEYNRNGHSVDWVVRPDKKSKK